MFIDRVTVTLVAGKGGNGCVSFRREKFVPRGGPDGGDGGKGGDIVLRSRSGLNTLAEFAHRPLIRAEDGEHGRGKKQYGKNGCNVVLQVPAGTVVKTLPGEKIIFDFDREDLEFLIAEGGAGGRGNVHFKSSVNQAPRRAEKGAKGEKLQVILELKLIAFAGLVGFPNAGKSTLISKISGARPKIADYPFTTLTPNLGVVDSGRRKIVVADIPGIIAGAHRGEGMGLEFLRHIERTRALVFLVDVSPFAPLQPLAALRTLESELDAYHPGLLKKKRLVAANKVDLLEHGATASQASLAELRAYCRKQRLPFVEISALKETGLRRFRQMLFAFTDG